MKKFVLMAFCVLLLFGSCAKEFNQVYKSPDYRYRYEYAKECFVNGKYTRAVTLLQGLIVQQKGTAEAQESLYMLAMAEYLDRDYTAAAEAFKRYVKSYPRGMYAEMASYHVGQSLYMSTAEPRLDQTTTVQAIAAFQEYMDLFPDAQLKDQAQQRLFELQDKLVEKELHSAQLYYNLGSYFGNCGSGGNNYEACIITAQNALKDYPYSSHREDFAVLVMKSKYELAQQSVEEKKLERYQDAEDECYGFINEYPDSKERKTAENFIQKCKRYTANAVD
ncbi:MAG: outer membrane protein assembly factor BamD [Prevotella sp.]|jgi:outer membrane protein assembly factor BamD